MFPGSTNGGGNLAVPGPLDACKTPSPGGPVPIPYPNLGQVSGAKGSSVAKKVKFAGKKVCTKKTEISRSSGDEAGTAGGGVVSSKNMGPISYKNGSGKVKVEGEQCVHLTSMTGHNGSNANVPAGVQVAPSQTKVLVSP
jgi:Toxin PAAR-like domain